MGWVLTLLRSKYLWAAIAASVVIGLSVHWKGKYDDALATAERLQQEADQRKKDDSAEAARQLKNKERTDEENARNRAELERQRNGLLESIANRPIGFGDDPKRPDLIAFDRAEFTRALQEYRREAAGIAAEGAACVADLDALKGWAKTRGN